MSPSWPPVGAVAPLKMRAPLIEVIVAGARSLVRIDPSLIWTDPTLSEGSDVAAQLTPPSVTKRQTVETTFA
jgi:hypothetical protein